MKLLIAMLFMIVSGGAVADETAIEVGDVGSWAEFQSLPNPAGLGVVPIPALVAILAAKEREKGSPLTEAEVVYIRDRAVVMVLPDKGERLVESRGYKDIDPQYAWAQWQIFRAQLRQ